MIQTVFWNRITKKKYDFLIHSLPGKKKTQWAAQVRRSTNLYSIPMLMSGRPRLPVSGWKCPGCLQQWEGKSSVNGMKLQLWKKILWGPDPPVQIPGSWAASTDPDWVFLLTLEEIRCWCGLTQSTAVLLGRLFIPQHKVGWCPAAPYADGVIGVSGNTWKSTTRGTNTQQHCGLELWRGVGNTTWSIPLRGLWLDSSSWAGNGDGVEQCFSSSGVAVPPELVLKGQWWFSLLFSAETWPWQTLNPGERLQGLISTLLLHPLPPPLSDAMQMFPGSMNPLPFSVPSLISMVHQKSSGWLSWLPCCAFISTCEGEV